MHLCCMVWPSKKKIVKFSENGRYVCVSGTLGLPFKVGPALFSCASEKPLSGNEGS